MRDYTEDWFKREINGLILVIKDAGYWHEGNDNIIHASYIIEKLELIRDGKGINFHQVIKDELDVRG